MTTPFEQYDPIEEWMTQPFYTAVETPMEIESWMTKPFEYAVKERDVKVEPWMADTWN